MPKTQRIRDSVHGLIVFDAAEETDQIAWNLINTREFQRLRRIRQLGFSDLVYPGATHSRFAHSLGVYHMARRLVQIIKRKSGLDHLDRERVVLLAALLHDIGHGPFSHTFEAAAKAAGKERRHEDWSAAIITGDSEVHQVLDSVDECLATEIAALLREEETKDIYATLVSSQFDADRLDYLQRDRLMTGVGFGHIDTDWLLDCLEVGTVTVGGEEAIDEPVEEDCLYLSPKGMRVAEEYLEARFRLYTMVYMHKTTRGAEKMLDALMRRLAELTRENAGRPAPAELSGPLYSFFAAEAPDLSAYITLDDTVVWAQLSHLRSAVDPAVAGLAGRLCDRRLYKCFDLGARMGDTADDNLWLRFVKQMRDSLPEAQRPLIDDASVSLYKWYDFQGRSALNKVLVKRRVTDAEPVDIGAHSTIVKALRENERMYRLYVPDRDGLDRLDHIWKEVAP